MASVLTHLFHAPRGHFRSNHTSAFTVTVVLTLAIGIGTLDAAFSVADAVVLKPLGYPAPDRLYVVHETMPAPGRAIPEVPVHALHAEEWRRSISAFESVSVISPRTVTFIDGGEPQRIGMARVSPSVFPELGLQSLRGRLFSSADITSGNEHVVVIGDGLWRSHFGATPNVIGRAINLDGIPYVVIGVLAGETRFPDSSALYQMTVSVERPQAWTPFVPSAAERGRAAFNHAAIVRLKDGHSSAEGIDQLNAVQTRLGEQLPGGSRLGAKLVPLKTQLTQRAAAGIQILLLCAALVLVACCVNVASLFVARVATRRREFAIRQATGATGRHIFSQLCGESLALALGGGVLGTALGYVLMRVIVTSAPADLPRLRDVAFDMRTIGFTALLTIGTGLLVAIVGAWWLSRQPTVDVLRAGAATANSGGGMGSRMRAALVACEVAAATMSLVVAGLLVSSFAMLLRVDRGFETKDVVGATLFLPRTRYNTERATRFLEAMRDGASAIPGVASIGLSDRLPLSGEGGNLPLLLEGATDREAERPIAALHLADASFFRTLRIPRFAGRLFEPGDRNRTPVAIVSTTAAERLWPRDNPLGKRFRLAEGAPAIEVVGIVGHIRGVTLESRPRLDVYLPYWFTYVGQVSVVARVNADRSAVVAQLRHVVRRTDPELAVPAFQSMDDLLADAVAPRRFQTILVVGLAFTAILLAVIGIYGTTSYMTSMRTTEIGLRMALGATHRNLLTWMIGRGIKPIAAGVGAGLLVSISLGNVLKGVVFGISETDTLTLVTAAAVLLVVGTVATYMPARRALGVNPAVAFRHVH